MRGPRFLTVILAAVTLAACMRQEPAYSVHDPQSGNTIAALPQHGLGGKEAFASSPPTLQQPSVLQYRAPEASHARANAMVADVHSNGDEASAALAYGAVPAEHRAPAAPYTLDAGDKLRVVVFGQQGISNSYTVDAGGNVTLPLVGTIAARGRTTQALARTITEKLKRGYVREPNVSVEV
ncbi:MAG TPA: polysaccharide biosynthesis/export family protein, partial [Pseudolabrys sp.]|nr:polysaccharide biosynthesis/export family protein [Pseudolabrys sp.]